VRQEALAQRGERLFHARSQVLPCARPFFLTSFAPGFQRALGRCLPVTTEARLVQQ